MPLHWKTAIYISLNILNIQHFFVVRSSSHLSRFSIIIFFKLHHNIHCRVNSVLILGLYLCKCILLFISIGRKPKTNVRREFQDYRPAGAHTRAFYIPQKCPKATCFNAGKLMQMANNPSRKPPICINEWKMKDIEERLCNYAGNPLSRARGPLKVFPLSTHHMLDYIELKYNATKQDLRME